MHWNPFWTEVVIAWRQAIASLWSGVLAVIPNDLLSICIFPWVFYHPNRGLTRRIIVWSIYEYDNLFMVFDIKRNGFAKVDREFLIWISRDWIICLGLFFCPDWSLRRMWVASVSWLVCGWIQSDSRWNCSLLTSSLVVIVIAFLHFLSWTGYIIHFQNDSWSKNFFFSASHQNFVHELTQLVLEKSLVTRESVRWKTDYKENKKKLLFGKILTKTFHLKDNKTIQ